MPLKDRGTQGGPLEPVIIGQIDEGVIFIPGLAVILTVGPHAGPVTVPDVGLTIVKPATATHIQLQPAVQNITYTIDDSAPTAIRGFELIPGSITTVPVPNNGLRVFPVDTPGSTIQYQWLRSR